MNLRPDMVFTEEISTLSQAIHGELMAIRKQTERLQNHANRKWRH